MENKTHIFCQIGPEEPKRFAFGNSGARFSEHEVEALIKMLPPADKVIKIVWVKSEWPEWHPGNPKNRETKLTTNGNIDT